MPEREALRLDHLMPHYGQWLGGPPEEPPAEALAQEGHLFFGDPVKLGWGPHLWSSSTVVARRDYVCHDVNGYYRELGVDWRCTKKDLREAYERLGGQGSPRLTYIFKQLINPLIREAYDRTPLGMAFMDDYTQEWLRNRACMEAAERLGRTGAVTSAEEVLEEWGFQSLDTEEGPFDTVFPSVQDLSQDAAPAPWGYASFAWKTSTLLRNEERLSSWQAQLTIAAAERSVHTPLAIGSTAMSVVPFTLVEVNGEWVILFSEDENPSLDVAGAAIDQFLSLPH